MQFSIVSEPHNTRSLAISRYNRISRGPLRHRNLIYTSSNCGSVTTVVGVRRKAETMLDWVCLLSRVASGVPTLYWTGIPYLPITTQLCPPFPLPWPLYLKLRWVALLGNSWISYGVGRRIVDRISLKGSDWPLASRGRAGDEGFAVWVGCWRNDITAR